MSDEDVKKNTKIEAKQAKLKKIESIKFKLMKYYNKESSKIIKYSLIALSILFFIYLIFILLPQNTIKGVDGRSYLKQDKNRIKIDMAFAISEIPKNYTLDETIAYTSKTLKEIDSTDSQFVYAAALDYLSSNCMFKLDKNNKILFDSIMKKINNPDITSTFDGKNLVKHAKLLLCTNEVISMGNSNEINFLEKEIKIVENKEELLMESIQFDKVAYGDVYDEATGIKRYKNKSYDSLKEDDEKTKQLKKINSTKKELNKKIIRAKEKQEIDKRRVEIKRKEEIENKERNKKKAEIKKKAELEKKERDRKRVQAKEELEKQQNNNNNNNNNNNK